MSDNTPRCPTCFGALPCREHPAPPKLSFAGGTHFEPNEPYKTEEKPREISGGVDDQRSGVDDAGWPTRDSPVASRSGQTARDGEVAQGLESGGIPDEVPLRVQEASERLDATSQESEPKLLRIPSRHRTVADALGTASRMKLDNVIILSIEADGALVWLTNDDLTVGDANWTLDRAKDLLMNRQSYEHDDTTA